MLQPFIQSKIVLFWPHGDPLGCFSISCLVNETTRRLTLDKQIIDTSSTLFPAHLHDSPQPKTHNKGAHAGQSISTGTKRVREKSLSGP